MKRKSMFLGVLLVVVALVVLGCTGVKPSGQTKERKESSEDLVITNQEKFYQFQRPGKGWDKYGPDKFNDYWFVKDDATIYIGSLTSTESLREIQYSWIGEMRDKYKWESMEIVEEREYSIIDAGNPWFLKAKAFWSIIEYKKDSRTWKEKIYLVEGDKFCYRLRLSCPKRYFDRYLGEFEQLVKTFKMLKETTEESKDEDKKALGITKRSPIKPGEETFERPQWKRGDQWRHSFRISTEGILHKTIRKVVGKEKFEGTVCYVAGGPSGLGVKWYWTLDLNLKAFISQGEIQFRFIPEQPLLDWPLQVGKTWEATYIGQARNQEPETIKAEFKVVKKEKVRVPAGEFWTLKIIEKVNGALHEEAWYSPKVKMFVKQKEYQIMGGKETVLTWELLKYKVY